MTEIRSSFRTRVQGERAYLLRYDGCTNFNDQVAFLRKAMSRLGDETAKP